MQPFGQHTPLQKFLRTSPDRRVPVHTAVCSSAGVHDDLWRPTPLRQNLARLPAIPSRYRVDGDRRQPNTRRKLKPSHDMGTKRSKARSTASAARTSPETPTLLLQYRKHSTGIAGHPELREERSRSREVQGSVRKSRDPQIGREVERQTEVQRIETTPEIHGSEERSRGREVQRSRGPQVQRSRDPEIRGEVHR